MPKRKDITDDDRANIHRLKELGYDAKHISCALEIMLSEVRKVLGISPQDEERIRLLVAEGYDPHEISCLVDLTPATISRFTGIALKKKVKKVQESAEAPAKPKRELGAIARKKAERVIIQDRTKPKNPQPARRGQRIKPLINN